MKLIIKNLKQVTYDVEIDSDTDTVLTLKKRIEEKHNFNHETFKLVFNQKILEQDKALKEYNIQEGNVIIMMNSTVKPKPKDPEPEKKPEEAKKEETTSSNKSSTDKPSTTSSSQPKPKVEKNYDNEIKQLMD